MNTFKSLFFAGIIVVLIGVSGMFFTVSEYDQAVITQFGRPVRSVSDPGLHFKVPFIQKVTRYDKRILRWDGDPKEVPTKDKRFIWVDITARWKIVKPMRFLRVIGTYDQAYAKLDDTIDSIVKDFVSSTPLVELVRTTAEIRRVKGSNDCGNIKKDRIESAAGFIGREKITKAILKEAEKAMPDFGIELVDVRIKRINYVESVRKKVYERMISERKRKASLFRSEGEGKKAEILGQMDKELKKITSGAFKTAEEIKGKADAEATRIYGKAYNQDPEFYAFYKALQTYSNSSFENATVIMGTDSDYYAFLKDIKGR